jgi:putative molybdopterin biosynthesis protein
LKKVFRTLVDVDDAKNILFEYLDPHPLGVETVNIFDAINRVLAEDITAKIDVPPFDRSLRDGYAVRYEDVSMAREDAPVRLKIVGYIEAGHHKDTYVRSGEAVRISTGAPIPGGANSVIMEEYTREEDGYVYVYKPVKPGEWIQFTGSDIMYGEVVLPKGTILTSREIGVVASLGVSTLRVYRKPKVAIISTGDEIVEVGGRLKYGLIYDVNGYTLYSMLIEDGAEPHYLGVVGDDIELLHDKIEYGLKYFDIVFTSGSTSVGLKDNLYKVISDLENAEIIFHGVKASPGKPTIAAIAGGKLLAGLPGFPVSCLMIYDNIFSDIVRSYSGLGFKERMVVSGVSGAILRGREGVKYFQPVFLKNVGDELYFYPIHIVSGAIASLANADGYVIIPENVSYIDRNEGSDVFLFSKEIKASDLIVMTSHSIVFENIVSRFRGLHRCNLKFINVGSVGGINAIVEGFNDISGIHILDEDTSEYNIPYLEKVGLKNVILYRGFDRELGFVVKPGNPLGISSFEDLLGDEVRFINRVQGSGTRIFIDNNLREVAQKYKMKFDDIVSRIEGYSIEAKTHTAVVSAIEAGKADVGVTTRTATLGRNVEFITLSWEKYDFLVNKESLEKIPLLSQLIEYMRSEDAMNIVKMFKGVSIGNDYMKIMYES